MRQVQGWIKERNKLRDWYIYSILSHNEYDLYQKIDLEMIQYAAKATGSHFEKGKTSKSPELVYYYFENDVYRAHRRDSFIIHAKLLHMYLMGKVGSVYCFFFLLSPTLMPNLLFASFAVSRK